ncbi:hypothetical protein Clacol_006502 [Clathrus columnatus]|uniref:Nucleolar protein 16 n=1 Tax=Clathrus columnatus TaxID=1419009 RepID=A0AAV5AIF7_9AGAM|nr:hypothetical protein Clacol_006502 [Clathrus columnatus]
MVNPRQRRKTKAATHKKTRPSRHAQVLQDAWDKKKTVRQNYAALGLARSLKPADSGGNETSLFSLTTLRTETVESSSEIRKNFGKIIRDAEGNVIDVQLPEKDPIEENEDIPRDSHKEESLAKKSEVLQALEKIAQSSRPVQRFASDAETAALKRLINKHGSKNYEAMAKDLRLNPWQRQITKQ